MKLTCFGKYGPYPKGGYATSCYMITYNGKNILLDLGCGALSKVFEKIRVQDIDAIVLSHLHADHMGDMLTLRYALMVGKKMGFIEKPIPVFLPEEPQREASLLVEDELMNTAFITDGMESNLFGIDFCFSRMPHAVPSYAVSLCADGKKFVYSGDTEDNDHLAVFAKDADMFLMEAALLVRHKVPGSPHVSTVDAGRIAKEAKARRLLVTHLLPEYDPDEVVREVQEQYPQAEMIEEQKVYEV